MPNTNTLASTGFDLSNPDYPRILSILAEVSKLKKGGHVLNTAVLFTKTCIRVKELAGFNGPRLPEEIGNFIREACETFAENRVKSAREQGFMPVKETGIKSKFNYRDGNVTRAKAINFEQVIAFDDQIRDVQWEITLLKGRIAKLEERICDSQEQITTRDAAIEKLRNRIEKLDTLRIVIQVKREETLQLAKQL